MSANRLRRASLARALYLIALAPFASCIFVADGYRDSDGVWHGRGASVEVQSDDDDADEAAEAAEETAGTAKPSDKGAKADVKAEALAEKGFELEQAKLALAIAKLSTATDLSEAALSLARAEREHADAARALSHFKEFELPLRVQDGEMDLEQARFGIEMKKIELEELIAMYKSDEGAASTKEIVVKRDTKELEFMQRSLGFQEARFAALKDFELPHELAEKEDAARKAEEALAKAKVDSQKAELEAKKALAEAEHGVAKLEAELAKLEAELAKLEKPAAQP